MNSRQKGNVGHTYTKTWLEGFGWRVHTEGHQQIIYQKSGSGMSPRWGSTGRNDAFSVPDPLTPSKREGGFDHFAVKPFKLPNDKTILITTLWQTKKTQANPITPAFKRLIIRCADAYHLPLSACFGIWWPNGSGPKGSKGPMVWRADWDCAVDYSPWKGVGAPFDPVK